MATNSGQLLLTSENYFTWTTMIESELNNVGALDFILGLDSQPKETLEAINWKAYNLIIRYLDENNLAFVSSSLDPLHKQNGQELWKLLKDKYMSNDVSSQTLAFTNFSKIEFKETLTFITDIRAAVSKMRLVGFKLKEKALVIMILSKMPKELESFVRIISHGYENRSVDFVQFKISSDNETAVAMFSKNKQKRKCTHCNRDNHSKDYCWEKYPEKRPKTFLSCIGSKNVENNNEVTFYEPPSTDAGKIKSFAF